MHAASGPDGLCQRLPQLHDAGTDACSDWHSRRSLRWSWLQARLTAQRSRCRRWSPFRSTLEEAKDASLLLHLVDASDPAFRDQLLVTREVLAQIGAGDKPRLLVLSKADRLDAARAEALRAEFPEARLMSARGPDDVAGLHDLLVEHFSWTASAPLPDPGWP